MKDLFEKYMRRRTRVYVLPTKMGGYLNGLIFLMFLLSVGYSSNLLLIFTLFLFGFNLLWVVQGHSYLCSLVPELVQVEDGHSGEAVTMSVRWKTPPTGSLALKLLTEESSVPVSEHGTLIYPKRGPWKWRWLKIESDRPFGLYRCWIYRPIDVMSVAWPALNKMRTVPPLLEGGEEGEVPGIKSGQGEYKGLLPYSFDEARRISWKHYARSGDLLIKEGEDPRAREAHFSYAGGEDLKEEKLSELATSLVFCHRHDISFSLKTPLKYRAPATHRSHLLLCLKDLALC